jgi:hypothetical protein
MYGGEKSAIAYGTNEIAATRNAIGPKSIAPRATDYTLINIIVFLPIFASKLSPLSFKCLTETLPKIAIAF